MGSRGKHLGIPRSPCTEMQIPPSVALCGPVPLVNIPYSPERGALILPNPKLEEYVIRRAGLRTCSDWLLHVMQVCWVIKAGPPVNPLASQAVGFLRESQPLGFLLVSKATL